MTRHVELIPVCVPMTEPFRISSGTVDAKESILIRIERDGRVGWGEASPMSGAFYSTETPESTLEFLNDHVIPDWIDSGTPGPDWISDRLASTEGNRFAWAGMEGALWDIRLQEENRSFLEAFGSDSGAIESGLAIGIHPSIGELVDRTRHYLREGYKRIKIKIEPGWDIEPLEAIRKEFPGVPLMVDANSAYGREDFSHLKRLDRFGLVMIEQPLPAGDLTGHAELQRLLETPICLDESAESLDRVREAARLGSCRIVNIKVQRVGGLTAARGIHDFCRSAGIANWMGTMPELGIASLHALYLATLPNCVYPTDVEASARWYEEDVIDPPLSVREGLIVLPEEHQLRPRVNETVVERRRTGGVRIDF